MKYLLALDEGTTSARSALYDEEGRRVAMESRPVECRYPQSGWVEQDAAQLLERQLESARGLLARFGLAASEIAAIGITNQRESVVVWDRGTGVPSRARYQLAVQANGRVSVSILPTPRRPR